MTGTAREGKNPAAKSSEQADSGSMEEDDNLVAVDWTSDQEEETTADVDMQSTEAAGGSKANGEKKDKTESKSKPEIDPSKTFLTHVVKGPVRIGTLDVTDLSNTDLQALLLKARKSTFDFDRKKGVVTMWYDPDKPVVAAEILASLARLKLSSEEISIACPRVFAALLATEKRRQKFPDFQGGQKKDKSAYCTNIPPDTSEEVLRAIFPECSNVLIPRGEDGKNFGCAILEFKSGKAAQACIEGNKDIEVGDNKVTLGFCYPMPPEAHAAEKKREEKNQQKKKTEKVQSDSRSRARSTKEKSGNTSSSDRNSGGKSSRTSRLGGNFSSSRLSASKVVRNTGRAAVGRAAVGRAAVGRGTVGRAAVGRGAVGRGAVNQRRRSSGLQSAPSTSMLMNQMQALTNMVINKQQTIAEQQSMTRQMSSSNQSTNSGGGSMGRMTNMSVSNMGMGMSNMGNTSGRSNVRMNMSDDSSSRLMDTMDSYEINDWKSSGRRNLSMEESGRRLDSFGDDDWQDNKRNFGQNRLDTSFGSSNRGKRDLMDNQRNQMNQKKQGNRGGVKRGGGDGDICFKCGQNGHFARECPTQEKRAVKIDGGCFKCGQQGHYARECPSNSISDRAGGQGRQNRQNRMNTGGRQSDYDNVVKRNDEYDYEARISDDVPFMTGIATQSNRNYDDNNDSFSKLYTNKQRNMNFDDDRNRNRSNIGNQQWGMGGSGGSGGSRDRQRNKRGGNLGDSSSDFFSQRSGQRSLQMDNSMSLSRSPDPPRDSWTSAQSKWEQYMARQNQSDQSQGNMFESGNYRMDDDLFY